MTDMDDWDFSERFSSTLSRHYEATPKKQLVVDYKTVERYHGRLIDVTYPAEISNATISHHWDEKKQAWRSNVVLNIYLLNPKTMERYSITNPKSARIQTRDDDITEEDAIKRHLMAATVPFTRIVITEVPNV